MCGEDAPEGYEAIRDTAANEVVGVLEILGDTSNKHRRSLIRCLEMQTQTPRIQNAFANLLSDPVPVIRAEALLKLNQTRKDILLRFSNDPYAVVREAMVFRAYDLGKKERYDLYLRMMHDRAEGVAISAAKGIGLTEDPRFVKDATNLLTSPRKGVVEAAAVAMQESFKPEFIPPLKKALANQKHLGRGQIAFALARLANGNEALFFRDYLSDKDIEVVSHACSALGNAKDKQSIPMLTKLAARKDGDVAFFAAEALRQIKG